MSLQNRLNCSFTVEIHPENEHILAECFHDNSEDEEEAAIAEAFQAFDQDGDGFLSAQELRGVLRRLGEHVTESELEECMRFGDRDKDGKLSYGGKQGK